ncbi:hypothetical protein SUDANB145_00939 [Streptomyces sp. enrichment culture]|uniref:DoxX family protein n=1 Tax=Streptomyces sp. enrichment culture TaxID=1795815 RepID=UPI003F559420
MNLAYWIVAGLLAAFYLYSGAVKTVWSRERLRPMMAWVDSMPLAAVRVIGLVEVLGAAGLILPRLTGIAAWLSPAAAIGFVLLQVGATAVHLRMGDRQVALNAVLLLVAGAAAWAA